MDFFFKAVLFVLIIIAACWGIIWLAEWLFLRSRAAQQMNTAHIIQDELDEERALRHNGVMGDRARAKKAREGDIHKG